MYMLSTPEGFLPFPTKIEYAEQVPIYFALHDPQDNFTVLCRELTPSEKETDFKKISYLIDTDTDANKNIGKPCLLLFKVPSLEKASCIVASYKKGLAKLQTLENTAAKGVTV